MSKSTVESFAHLTDNSPISLDSASPTKQKTQLVVQVRKDYMQDISKKMRECLTQSGGEPQLKAR